MPLPMDDNRQPVQALHPVGCHQMSLTAGEWTSTAPFKVEEVLAVELQPEYDTVIRFYDGGPEVYLRGGGYFVYDTRQYTKLDARPGPTATAGLLVVTELG